MRRLSIGILGLALGMSVVFGFLTSNRVLNPPSRVSASHGFPMDFEAKAKGISELKWHVRADGYASEIISWDAAWGRRSLRLHQVADDADAGGEITTAIAGKEVHGKKVEFSAKLKNVSAPGAQLWIQIDRLSGGEEAQESECVPIGGWKSMSIIADVPSDAKSVTLGIRTTGGGDVLVDDVDFRCEG